MISKNIVFYLSTDIQADIDSKKTQCLNQALKYICMDLLQTDKGNSYTNTYGRRYSLNYLSPGTMIKP